MTSLFEQVNATIRHARSGTAIGVVTHDDRALLVDSGLDENLVRKIVNALANEGVRVAAIVNTHSHADHIGGNAWACRRTGCLVAAPAYEHVFIERPELEPYTLFGAPAPRALSGKFLQAEASRVGLVVDAPGERDVAGFHVRFHALPGHTVGQMGVEVDGVLFAGDALLPTSTLSKYGVAFAVDPQAARESLERLAQTSATVVSYHGGVATDLEGLARANADAIASAEEAVLARLRRGPASDEEVLAELLDRFPPAQRTVELHVLQAATVRGYLATLERAGRAVAFLDGPRMLWRTG